MQAQLDSEVNQLSSNLFAWINAKLPPGTVIDLRHRKVRSDPTPLPGYLASVSVLVGNARGTRVFRIEHMQRVDLDIRYPEQSTWIAKATPINEATGKDMTGKAGNPKSYMGTDFQLRGRFCLQPDR